ncbi:hypothetical protein [Desulfomonile tiedjei]|uniref:VWFA domain-containing protein n=1 Tax=Desulfomonile tiedjei (strain ATCC 49306 / DSM 6799 / DCB-1) TaxID=706587 RepID=I4C7X7_DESTA|nr:hypothetical protein [Desulfomonile tiedjei]AFM25668.1 hypothetical protein Desti_3002 [Desulfomonile tiedjei DSM 6799]
MQEKSDLQSQKDQAGGSRKRSLLKLLLTVGFAVAAVVVAYKIGSDMRAPSSVSPKTEPSFGRSQSDNLFSSGKLLKGVGQSPVDPSKVLFPSMEKTLDPNGPTKAKTCPPGVSAGASTVSETQHADDRTAEAPILPSDREPTLKTEEGPSVEARVPEPTVAVAEATDGASDPAVKTGTILETTPQDKGGPTKQKTSPKKEVVATTPPSAPEINDKSKAEQFQLPGSMTVKIHNYSGAVAKWGLMVILDDSAHMARKNRLWAGNRLKSATNLIEKIPEGMPPGSKLAVRDFQCSKPDKDRKKKPAPCLSRMLYDWSEAPFPGLNDKFAELSPGGVTNPCAAAAFSLKKDFEAIKASKLSPRVLIVTDGSGKCLKADAAAIVEQLFGKESARVDVLGLGMAKNKDFGYSSLAKKTNGVFFTMNNPGDTDQVLSRYGKALKAPIMEKITIKGEKSVFTAVPGEEVTLVPGEYSVELPVVAGIQSSKRTIQSVKISSGEAVVLDIKVKKGKLTTSRSIRKLN